MDGAQIEIRPGTRLGGFVIESVAGRGGMGVVYRARQLRPDRIVAVKVIAPELAGNEAFRARFERESAIAAQIEHPNVIPVHAVGEQDGVLFIAMRFVEGADLRTLLSRWRRLEPTRAASLVDQVARALDAAHARGLVHRDVKPANILVADSGGREHAYLSDFGLSRLIDATQGLTASASFVGSIDYVAPEQARGERVDARTDVYSLGCVLFHVLTGSVPYPLTSDVAKLYAHASRPPPSVLEHAPDLPHAFGAVIARAMAKAPEDRYLSAGDLGRAALAAASGQTVARAERSVGRGDAAPGTARAVARARGPAARPAATTTVPPAGIEADSPFAPRRRRRAALLAGLAVALVAVAGAIIALASGGGSNTNTNTGASGAAAGAPERVVKTRQTTDAKHDTYRLVLSTPRVPDSTPPSTRVPYYLTEYVRHGRGPSNKVDRIELPWTFTASSVVADFRLDANPGGGGNVGLSYWVKNGDHTDQTHYMTLTPVAINIDS